MSTLGQEKGKEGIQDKEASITASPPVELPARCPMLSRLLRGWKESKHTRLALRVTRGRTAIVSAGEI